MTGIKFGNIHSDTLGLNWLGVFTVSPPVVATKYVDIPGRNGSLDYSQALTGHVTYEDRDVTMEFLLKTESGDEYTEKSSGIMNILHGQRMLVVADVDPDFQWDCRLEVSDDRKSRQKGVITVTGTAYPYKRKTADTVVEQTVTDTATEITCNNLAEPVVPTIETSASMRIQFGGKTHNVQKGTHTIPDIVFLAGENVLTVTGPGTIKITYREGSL